MQLTAVGLNHQTAPLDIRERLAFAAAALPQAVADVLSAGAAREAVILSTCNRTEIYASGHSEAVIEWWAQYHGLSRQAMMPHLYVLDTAATVRHAFRVACGLDSMVLGEPQILGQIKEAVRVAHAQHGVGKTLHALFQKTFATAKTVRTHTAVGENSVSMAAASVKLAEQIFPNVSDLQVLFIGAGEMIELVATYFAAKQPRRLSVLNRTLSRAEALCQNLNTPADADRLSQLPEVLHHYDVVVSSTASPLPIVGKGLVERALKQRRGRPVFLLDLAVPRDIEAEVAELDDAFLYTVDDMMGIVESGKDARSKAAAEAEALVADKTDEFMLWCQHRQAVPLICDLRRQGEAARQQVLAKAMKQLARGRTPEEVLTQLSVQLTNKLLHPPTRSLNQDSRQHPELASAICRIYDLDQA